ncbi:hypothetical protein OKW21_000197 [Catalinimonas alkaloidigena]|nr:hypothetical protein [Catalinimonas alkaloidigena]
MFSTEVRIKRVKINTTNIKIIEAKSAKHQ